MHNYFKSSIDEEHDQKMIKMLTIMTNMLTMRTMLIEMLAIECKMKRMMRMTVEFFLIFLFCFFYDD